MVSIINPVAPSMANRALQTMAISDQKKNIDEWLTVSSIDGGNVVS
jgi:hypothetical protein